MAWYLQSETCLWRTTEHVKSRWESSLFFKVMESHTVYTMEGWGTGWSSQPWTWKCNMSFRKLRSRLNWKSWQRYHPHLLSASRTSSKEDDSQSMFSGKPKGESPCSDSSLKEGAFGKSTHVEGSFQFRSLFSFQLCKKYAVQIHQIHVVWSAMDSSHEKWKM